MNLTSDDLVDTATITKDVFLRSHIGRTFYPYQKAPSDYIVKSLIENNGEEIILEFARQSGKTELVADTMLYLALYMPEMGKQFESLKRFKNGIRIGIFGPAAGRARITYDRMGERFKYVSQVNMKVETYNGDTLKLSNGSVIKCLSASETSNILGETFDLIILEECQDIGDRKLKLDIFPMGASTNATRVMIGTPAFHKSYFYFSIMKYEGKPNCFMVDADTVINYIPNYKTYLEQERQRLGEDSDEFQSQYYLKWILERGMFITEPKFEELVEGHELLEAEKLYPCYVGIDWGKINDSTVVTILRKRDKLELVGWLELLGDDYSDQLLYIKGFLDTFKVLKITCDATGTQDQIVDQLKAMFRNSVEGFKLTASGNDVIYKKLSDVISKKEVCFPKLNTREGRKFKQQFLDLEKEYKGNMLSCHHPDDKDAHDDYCCSLALAVYAATGRKGREMISNSAFRDVDISRVKVVEAEW